MTGARPPAASLHPAFLFGLLTRSAIIWCGVRGLLLFAEALLLAELLVPTPPAALLVPKLPAALLIVALTAVLTVLDGRRHSETVLLANLGVPEWRLALLAVLPPAAIESVIQVLA